MKIKVRPEDFIVEERASLPFKEGGRYRVYQLTKRNFNTVDLLIKLSKRLGISFKRFSYGGKKDRYGLTSQYITIEDEKIKDISEESFSLKYVGDMDRPMGPDLIEGNIFKVMVRDMNQNEIERVMAELPFVREYGYPNYFDDQRFGSYSPQQGFIAEKILKRHYNGALKIYLTAIHPEDKKDEKDRKRFFYENWGNWEACLNRAKTSFEKEAFKILIKKEPSPFLRILQKIPEEELSLFFSAFQSYIWNRVAERVVMIYGGDLIKYRGNFWYYIFYRRPQVFDYMKSLLIPTASHKTSMPDELTTEIYNGILKELELRPPQFNLKKIRKAFFSTTNRPFIVIPVIKEYSIKDDDLYSGKKALYLNFELPRGSYGTMLIKRLLAE